MLTGVEYLHGNQVPPGHTTDHLQGTSEDTIVVFWRFSILLGPGRFSIACGSKFRAEVAYLEVGSSDLEQIREKNIF